MKTASYKEADAYQNPTRLFTLISNCEPPVSIIQHAFSCPEEVWTWIVSRKRSRDKAYPPRVHDDVVWKYLPIHLACLQPNPNKEMLLVMRDVFPNGLNMRDYQGNLPIHYLLQEGCEDPEILDIVSDEDFSCVQKKDSEGRTMMEIISQSKASENCKKVMRNWVKKRDTNPTELSPQRKSSIPKVNHQSETIAMDDCHHNFQNELLVAQKELNGLFKAIEKLEWECDAKDQTIDSLSAQLMSLEKQVRQNKEDIVATKDMGSCNNKEGFESDTVRSMKEKMAIDASIVSNQEDTINELKSEMEILKKEKSKAVDENKFLQEQVSLFEEKLIQHDDAVSHVRKVSNILQEDLKTKEKEIAMLKGNLASSKKEKEELEQKLIAKEEETQKKMEGFQDNMREQSETLSNLLKSLKEKEEEIKVQESKEVMSMKDQIAAKDAKLLVLERELEAANEKKSKLANQLYEKERELNTNVQSVENNAKSDEILALEKRLEEVLARNSDIANSLAEKERQINAMLQVRQQSQPIESMESYGSGSDSSSNREKSAAAISAARNYMDGPEENHDTIEIREKQSQLQSELRDIYSQIRAIMPSLDMNESLQKVSSASYSPYYESKEEGWKENHSADVAARRQLWENRRPWRVEAVKENPDDDVYNTGGWGQLSQRSGNSVYNI